MGKLISTFFAAIFVAVLLVGCGGKPSPDVSDEGSSATVSPDARPAYLRVPSGEPLTIDPHLVTDVGSHAYTGKLFGGLVRLEAALYDKNGKVVAAGDAITEEMITELKQGVYDVSAVVVPDLAVALPEPQYNDDGTVSYTFIIRDDAKFANGREVTAWDVAYSLDRAADPKTFSTTAELYLGDIVGVIDMQRKRIINRVSPNQNEEWVDLPGVRVLDEKTIRITIVGPRSYFLMKLTYPTAAVVDKVQVETVKNWTDRPNGTGPYRLVKRDVGEIVLEANPNYHGAKPKISRVVHYLSGGSTYPRYQNNEIEFAGIGVEDLQLLQEAREEKSNLHAQYFETVEMSTSYIGFNTKQAPFDDPKVRRAFAMTVDREGLAHEVLKDLVLPAYGILPPGMPGYRDGLKVTPYDPAEAKKLLAESKYAGNMPRVQITISGSGSAPSIILQSMVESWRVNLGVDVEIEQLDYANFLQEIQKGSFQMFSLGWVADYPDPEDFLDLKFHSSRSAANNETRYANAEVDKLLEQARAEPDLQKRVVLYQQAEDIILNDVPWIPLFHGKSSLLVKPYLCGYFPTPMGVSVLRYAYFCG